MSLEEAGLILDPGGAAASQDLGCIPPGTPVFFSSRPAPVNAPSFRVSAAAPDRHVPSDLSLCGVAFMSLCFLQSAEHDCPSFDAGASGKCSCLHFWWGPRAQRRGEAQLSFPQGPRPGAVSAPTKSERVPTGACTDGHVAETGTHGPSRPRPCGSGVRPAPKAATCTER